MNNNNSEKIDLLLLTSSFHSELTELPRIESIDTRGDVIFLFLDVVFCITVQSRGHLLIGTAK